MNNLPTYNEEDLKVRIAVAANGIVKKAVSLAKHARAGSVNIAEQKALEIAIAQLEIARGYKVISTAAMGIFKPIDNTGATAPSILEINGTTASGVFDFSSSKEDTAESLTNAINSAQTTPNYSAVLVGDEVHITSDVLGAAVNGYSIGLFFTPPGVSFEFIHFFGAQDGVLAEDNTISEDTLEALFNNISNITGEGYAPLGTQYSS